MGVPKPFCPEKLIVGVLFSREDMREKILYLLTEAFGRCDHISENLDFNATHYYDDEIGTPIKRFFVSFKNLKSPATLASVKQITNKIERQLSCSDKRKVNLDPGFISLSRFVLASTKDSAHRVPLQDGIYAEVTLIYERGAFRKLEWTYADYRSEEYRVILQQVRNLYRQQLREKTAVVLKPIYPKTVKKI